MRVALIVSITLNALLGLTLFNNWLAGESKTAGDRLGVLTKDVEVGLFDHPDALFTIPKNLVVRDSSATGPGWIEPHRFTIVVTSDDASLLDFDSVPPGAQEFFSAERNSIGRSTGNSSANKVK